MRKSFPLFIAASLAVCLSCTKQEEQTGGLSSGSIEQGDFDYITAVGPGAEVKTMVSNGTKVLWTDADKIAMYGGSSASIFSTILEEPSAQARFGRTSTNKPAKVDGNYYAVYPSSAVALWSISDVASAPFCSVNIPKLQTAEVGTWDKKAAILVAISEDNNLAFKHAVSYLRFEVTEQTGDFVLVRALSNNNEMLSDAQAGVKFLPTGAVEVSSSASAVDYVTLQNPESGASYAEGAYYIAVLPGTYSQGITLSFTDAEGNVADETTGPLTLNPGEVADWGAIAELNFAATAIPLEKCSIYSENDVNLGVVFWVNPRKPHVGKIVSGPVGVDLSWCKTSGFNGSFSDADCFDTSDSKENFEYVTSWESYQNNKEDYPAIKFCEDLGEEWRLPSKDELDDIYRAWTGYEGDLVANTAYHLKEDGSLNDSANKFDSLLAQCVDKPEHGKMAVGATTWYWTGQGCAADTKIRRTKFTSNYYPGTAWGKASNVCYVRCIRDVENTSEESTDEPTDEPAGEPGDAPGEE